MKSVSVAGGTNVRNKSKNALCSDLGFLGIFQGGLLEMLLPGAILRLVVQLRIDVALICLYVQLRP